MFSFIFMNLIVGLTVFVISKYLFHPFSSRVDYFISLFIVFLSLIIGSLFLLGVGGRLYFWNVIGLNILILLVIYSIVKILNLNPKKQVFPKITSFSEELFTSKVSVLCLSVIVSFLTVKLVINLFNPPFGWDSIGYHFSFPVEWLKHGNLNNPIVVLDDPSPTYYPVNGSLFFLWLIFPFKSAFLADLGQFPFFIIAVLSVYGISRKIGLSKNLSFYSSALFMLIPNFFKQLQIGYVDIMVASLFLVCVNFLFLLENNFCLQHVLIYSLSLGLLIGTKTLALPYSILLIIPFMVIWLKNNKKVHLIFIFALCILVFGGFSYFRNLIETGNPFYPLDLKLFNTHIFRGVVDKSNFTSRFISYDYSLGKILFHEGLGAQTLLLVFPAIFLALPIAFIKRRKSLNFNLIYFLLLPILIYFVYRYIIPLANARFLYSLMGLGIILGFYILHTLRVNKLMLNSLIIICVLASIPELAKRQELIVSVILSVALFFVLINFKKINLFRNTKLLWILLILLAFGVLFWGEIFHKTNEFKRYYIMRKYSGFWPDATKAWDWLNANTTGNNIAFVGRAVPFPLYGSGFKNNVYYVSVNKVQPVKLHYFKNSWYEWGIGFEGLLKSVEQEYNYRGNADYNIWLENLLKTNTDYLFIYSLQQTKSTIFPIEDNWAKSHTDRFKSVFSNDTIHIYKIIK